MFSECDNCNENDFATKLFTTDIHKFKFLHLFEKITLNFTSRGQESGPGFVSALIYGFIQVNWPPEPLVSPLWDNKNSIHPGSKLETLMLTFIFMRVILTSWITRSWWFLSQYLSYPSLLVYLLHRPPPFQVIAWSQYGVFVEHSWSPKYNPLLADLNADPKSHSFIQMFWWHFFA